MQQPPVGLDGAFMFEAGSPMANLRDGFTAMPPTTQHGRFAPNNANFGGHTMAQPSQGGADMNQQGHGSDGNMAGPGNQPVGPTDSSLIVGDLPDDWSDFGYDAQFSPSSPTLTSDIPVDPALSSNPPVQVPGSEVNGQEGRGTACGTGSSADEYPCGMA